MTTYYGTEITVQLQPMTCGVSNCGVPFAISQTLYDKAQADHGIWFYCPNGHNIHFLGKSMKDELREAETRATALRDQLEAAAREAETVRAALIRDRLRFADGLCPCCDKRFDDVRLHMKSDHPDYDASKIVRHQRPPKIQCTCGREFSSLGGLHRHQNAQRGTYWYKPETSRWSAHLTKV